MTRFRHALIIAGVALGAPTLLPATPASADPIGMYAHAGFRSNDDNVSMDVDVARINGGTTIDVEWYDYQCGPTDTAYVCDSVSRRAYDVPVSRFSFSLTTTTVSAELPYQEIRRSCSYVEEQEDCTQQESTGTTTIEVTWTASGEPTSSEWTDEQGVLHVESRADATVSGSAFDRTYGGDQSFGVLHRVRTAGATS